MPQNNLTLLGKIRALFITGAGQWYKLWSNWLAGLFGLAGTVIWNDPGLLLWVAQSMPAQYRLFLSPVVFALLAVFPIVVRMLKQRKFEQQRKLTEQQK